MEKNVITAETTSGLGTEAVTTGKNPTTIPGYDPCDPWSREGKQGETHPILLKTGQRGGHCAVGLEIKQM